MKEERMISFQYKPELATKMSVSQCIRFEIYRLSFSQQTKTNFSVNRYCTMNYLLSPPITDNNNDEYVVTI